MCEIPYIGILLKFVQCIFNYVTFHLVKSSAKLQVTLYSDVQGYLL